MHDTPILIRTKDWSLTPEELFRINMHIAFNWKPARRILGITVAAIMLGASVWYFFGRDTQALIFGGITTIYLIYAYVIHYILVIRRVAYAPEDKAAFSRSGYSEFDREFMCRYFDDGSLTKLHLDRIFSVIKASDYYLLLSSGRKFIVMHRAFQSAADMQQFEALFPNKLFTIGTVRSPWDFVLADEPDSP